MFDQIGEPLSPEEVAEVADDVAQHIVKRGLITPAIMFLEMNKPITFLAGQGLVVAMPFIAPFLGAEKVAKFSRFLHKPENVEKLIQRIEELAEEQNLQQELEAKKNKENKKSETTE